MYDRELFSTGEAANAFGITRDALVAALRAGAPEPAVRLAGRRVFDKEDLRRLRGWFGKRGRPLEMSTSTMAPNPHTSVKAGKTIQ